MHDAFKGGANPVVIFGRDRVELMVMATGAVNREAKERAPSGGDHVVERGGTNHLLGHRVLIADVIIGARDKEGAADFNLRLEFAQDITGEVLAYQLVEGLVVVERTNDVIAERVKVIDDDVAFEAVALAKADHVKPVPSPMLAVARGGQ